MLESRPPRPDPPMYPKTSSKDGKKPPMKNITINIPGIYDENIKKLIEKKIIPSRSEAVRTALRDFLYKEYQNLELLGFYGDI